MQMVALGVGVQDTDLESKRAECAERILRELRASSAASDGSSHGAAFDRIIKEYQPLMVEKRISLKVFSELVALSGSIELALLTEEQRAQVLEVDGVAILIPLKEHFKEHVLLEEKSVHYQEEYERAAQGLQAVERSRSFRVGRAVTAIPRRIKSAIR